MTEWWMPQVVRKGCRLNDIGIEATKRLGNLLNLIIAKQIFRYAATDLCDLQRMRQAVVNEMTFGWRDDLGNATKAAKCGGIEDTIPITATRGPAILATIAKFVEAIVAISHQPAQREAGDRPGSHLVLI